MKNNKKVIFFVIFLFIGVVFAPSINARFDFATNEIKSINDGNHPPIYINGNEDFTPENGVTGGNGTEENPFIIEDWVIVGNGSASDGIFINNTDLYFVIMNCTVSNFSYMYDAGIAFNNVKNGRIEDTRTYGNDYGIDINGSSYITITSCDSFDNLLSGIDFSCVSNSIIEDSVVYNNHKFSGIDLDGSFRGGNLSVNNTIRNCKVFNNTIGIDVGAASDARHSSYHKILDSEIYDNGIPAPGEGGWAGIHTWFVDDITVENCSIYHNGRGIEISSSSNNIIRNNKIYNHKYNASGVDFGIVILGLIGKWGSFNNRITDCDIYDNGGGIQISRSINTRVQENNIFNNSYFGIFIYFYGIASINWNNIYGNGFDWEWGSGLWVEKSLIDARHNYWGADDGPQIYRLDRHANVYTIRDGHGDNIYRFRNILFIRPWATELVSDAGVN